MKISPNRSALPWGTLGWIVNLDGVDTGITCWHVINDAPVGWNIVAVDLNRTAGIVAEKEIDYIFDFCKIQMTDQAIDTRLMAPCQDGLQRPAPTKLATDIEITTDHTYSKVGARQPVCLTGRFVSFGSATVRYDDGLRSFNDQLYFTPMGGPGDSGSVIVSDSTNHSVGLLFAGDGTATLANPLYAKGWTYRGTRVSDFGYELPVLTSPTLKPQLISSEQEALLRRR